MSHTITPLDEIPKRKYTKGSVYDDVIDSFVEQDIPIARIEMTKKSDGLKLEGTYLSAQLRKRIKQRELTTVTSITRNTEAYLLKVTEE